MRFFNRTAVDQVVKTFADPRNPKTVTIPAGGEVIGAEYAPSARPTGPLTLADEETTNRREFQRCTTHNVRDILAPYFEHVLRERLRGKQASTTQSIAPLVGLLRMHSFSEFCNERALCHVCNSTMASDSVSTIIGRLEENQLMHHIKETVAPDKSTSWTSGLSIGKESWRRTTIDEGFGPLHKREGYCYEPQEQQPAPENFSPADLSAWSQLVRKHRDLIVNAIAAAIFTYVQGGLNE